MYLLCVSSESRAGAPAGVDRQLREARQAPARLGGNSGRYRWPRRGGRKQPEGDGMSHAPSAGMLRRLAIGGAAPVAGRGTGAGIGTPATPGGAVTVAGLPAGAGIATAAPSGGGGAATSVSRSSSPAAGTSSAATSSVES